MWLSATVRLSEPPDARQLRDARIAQPWGADRPLGISSLLTPSSRPKAPRLRPLPATPSVKTSQAPVFATSRAHQVLAPTAPPHPRSTREPTSARFARSRAPAPTVSPRRRGLRVGNASGLPAKPKTVTEWRDRRSRLHPRLHLQNNELPGVGVANRRERQRWESTRGLQDAAREAEQAAAELRELFAAHAPYRLTYLPSLLIQWEGREQELVAKVRHRYRFGIDRVDAEADEQRCRTLLEVTKQAYDEAVVRAEQFSADRQLRQQLEDGQGEVTAETGSTDITSVAGSLIQEDIRAKQRLLDLKERYERRSAELVAATRRRQEAAAAYKARQAMKLARQQAAQDHQQRQEGAQTDEDGPAALDEVGEPELQSDSMVSVASSSSSIFDVLATPRSRPLPEAGQRPHRGLMARLDRSSLLRGDFHW